MDYYKRETMLSEIGQKGLEKLQKAKVLVIGAGGLGCPALEYLATSGIGSIGIIDFDTVSETNLARQILYTYDDLGKFKAEVAAHKIKKMNPYIEVKYWIDKVNEKNIDQYLNKFDYVLDSPDNLETRYLIEEHATVLKKVIIHGSIFKFMGQVTVFTSESPCYRCVYPERPYEEDVPTCNEVGVFPALPSIIGVLQAMETIKYIVEFGEPLVGQLLTYNALDQTMKKYKLSKNENCPICGNKGDFE